MRNKNTREHLEKMWPGVYAINERESREIHAELVEKGKTTQTYDEWIVEMKEGWIQEMLKK